MPGLGSVQRAVRRVFQRWPALEMAAFSILDASYRIVLLPFRRPVQRAFPGERRESDATVDEYNAAAERYFAVSMNAGYLLGKPFSDPGVASKHLIDAGVLMQAMRLRPADVVVEIGAGTCWLSHMLNRYGCRTVAVDVSPTALKLGRQLFESDSTTNWSLQPGFLVYDGRTLPVADGACDRIVMNDAFHHVPNQRELLAEMHRILAADGVVAMSEPGLGHASAAHSVREVTATGVLERELVLEELSALARDCGFRAAHVVLASPYTSCQVPAERLGAFMGGDGFASYWKQFCGNLARHHYLVLYKEDPVPTTKRPSVLSARLEILGSPAARVRVGEPPDVIVGVTNLGDTRWLAAEGDGWTRIGAHLFRVEDQEPLDFDWCRVSLRADVQPGRRQRVSLTLPPLTRAGRYRVTLDLVIEGRTWFAEHGSSTLDIVVDVT